MIPAPTRTGTTRPRRRRLTAALLLLLTACSGTDDAARPDPQPRPVRTADILQSSPDRSPELEWGTAAVTGPEPAGTGDNPGEGADSSPTTIRLLTDDEYQTMRGFGAALTGSTAFNLQSMPDEARARFLTETFSPTDGFGFDFVRISIGASDFSLSDYTLADEPPVDTFELQDEELDHVIPVLLEILEINPDLAVMGSPWTAPPWMKIARLDDPTPHPSFSGGVLDPQHHDDYADYLVRWIEAMEDAGVPIDSITMQNEPLNPFNSASMMMRWEQQLEFVRDSLGPAIDAVGLDTEVWAFDHNYDYDSWLHPDQVGYPLRIYENPDAARHLVGAAYHNYGGEPDELLRVHDEAPDKSLIFTEASLGEWNDGRDLSARLAVDGVDLGVGLTERWIEGVVVWNLLLDADGGPWRPGGCDTCFGAADLTPDRTGVVRNSHYLVIAHQAAVIDRGAVRLGHEGAIDDIEVSVFGNPDGSRAAVLVNTGTGDAPVDLEADGEHVTVTVPAGGLTSVRWPTDGDG